MSSTSFSDGGAARLSLVSIAALASGLSAIAVMETLPASMEALARGNWAMAVMETPSASFPSREARG
jgi:hypothetical protein